MSKNIKDYTPGVNDFLHFAEVMNLNAQMDMKKSPAANGVAAVPQMKAPMANDVARGANGVAAKPQTSPTAVAQVATPSSVVGKDAYTKMGGKIR